MAEPDEPSTDFVEFVRIWGSTLSGTLQLCPEAIISYESRGRGNSIVLRRINFDTFFHKLLSQKISEFTVQVGHEVGDVRNHNGRNLGIITSAGNMLILQRRKRGNP